MKSIQGVKAKAILKYTLLPGIIPRINAFINSGFGWLALTMAIVYNGVRLLPNGHPYLSPANMGKFGIRHVIAEAANNLVIKKENIDQIVIFFALLLGFVILVMQFVAVILAVVIKPAAALGAFQGIFTTASCNAVGAACLDIAHMLLDKVFAVPEMFNSKFAPAAGLANIPAFNRGLQELFQYYSYAMLIVGVVIFLYYIVVIVGETATTGTPFGRRFNHIYAPLRLVGAIGLLIPLNYGYNGGQYITLIAARMGSGFATNGWIIYNQAMAPGATPIGTRKEALIARPNVPDVTDLAAAMTVIWTCKAAYLYSYRDTDLEFRDVQPYLIQGNPSNSQPAPGIGGYEQALAFYQNKDVVIRFGHLFDPGVETTHIANVEPTCGDITVPTNVAGGDAAGQYGPPSDLRIGPYTIQSGLYDMVMQLWTSADIENFGRRMALLKVTTEIANGPCSIGGLPGDCNLPPDAEYKTSVASNLRADFVTVIVDAHNAMLGLGDNLYDITPELLERGWGGAAIWYNKIAEWNGAYITAVINIASTSLEPYVSAKIQEQRRGHNESVDHENRFCPTIEGFRAIDLAGNRELQIGEALCETYRYWSADGGGRPSDMQPSGNVFHDLLNQMFGIGGLFTIRTNDDVHPLAQLSALGKSIIESSINNLFRALITAAGGGMGQVLAPHVGASFNSMSNVFVTFSSIGLTIGFILYYVLPFMPFMYFFFAVGSWIKTIFEAMVGVPLWALAHLRIDGNGFPGESASNGYFLIFEIFVRPILVVFGLVAAMGIFSGLARTLNGVFDLVVENLSGFDCANCDQLNVAGLEFKRNVIDEFFFTIIYTVLLYMLATSCFKLIDTIPQSILRWMGAGVQTFSDQAGDPAQGLVQYAAIGGAQLSQQVTGAMQSGARTFGMGVGTVIKSGLDLTTRNANVTGTPAAPGSGGGTAGLGGRGGASGGGSGGGGDTP